MLRTYSVDVNSLSVLKTNDPIGLHLRIKDVTISHLLILSSKNMDLVILRALAAQSDHAKELHGLTYLLTYLLHGAESFLKS